MLFVEIADNAAEVRVETCTDAEFNLGFDFRQFNAVVILERGQEGVDLLGYDLEHGHALLLWRG